MPLLNGKVAIVTGAASGIGKAIVQALLNENCKVLATDQHQEKLTALLQSLQPFPIDQLHTLRTDVSNEDEIEHMISIALSQFGKLDILINNAGIMDHFEPVGDISNLVWEKIMRVNLEGPMKAMRSAVRIFLKQGQGVILNIASIGGLFGCRAGAAYTTSKHGLIGLTKNTGYFYAKDGIRCNAIAPGFIETEMTGALDEKTVQEWRNAIPLKRGGSTEDVANATLFLASDMSGYITGQTLHVCGGMLM